MSTLLIIAYDDEFKAEQVRLELRALKRAHLVDLEEAVVVVRNRAGKAVLHHAMHFTAPGALGGGFLGTLAGLMLFNPVLAVIGGITGSALGAVTGALKELGIDDAFMKDLAAHLKPGSSALFVVAKAAKPELINEEVQKFGGRILQIGLEHEDPDRLHAAMRTAIG
jgi:uncharacterized membrane protein